MFKFAYSEGENFQFRTIVFFMKPFLAFLHGYLFGLWEQGKIYRRIFHFTKKRLSKFNRLRHSPRYLLFLKQDTFFLRTFKYVETREDVDMKNICEFCFFQQFSCRRNKKMVLVKRVLSSILLWFLFTIFFSMHLLYCI